uniref:F-box domain-containing protein n=1 Tax=Solanum lycopersicum TaxID=4081 RepID=K4BT31_SOLLC
MDGGHPIPEDVVGYIRLRLPMESLLRFKCVRKNWALMRFTRFALLTWSVNSLGRCKSQIFQRNTGGRLHCMHGGSLTLVIIHILCVGNETRGKLVQTSYYPTSYRCSLASQHLG